MIENVLAIRSMGIDRRNSDLVLQLLQLKFIPLEDGTGTLELILAGDGAIALKVETLELTLRDVTCPYIAPSGKVPQHQ